MQLCFEILKGKISLSRKKLEGHYYLITSII